MNKRFYYQQNRNEMLKFIPAEYTRVLEIGCAEGEFISFLKNDSEKWGVELNVESASRAKNKFNKLLIGDYFAVKDQLPDDYFDLIICNDIIEHFIDHDKFLASIKSKLRSRGFFVASLPNVRYYKNLYNLLIKKDWQYEEYGVLDSTHLRFFTIKSIRQTFEKHGFVLEMAAGVNKPKSVKTAILFALINILTLGYYSDIQFLQFGIRGTLFTD
ncbi:MAG: class I SAM-dependent methyltransferase [bacterium]